MIAAIVAVLVAVTPVGQPAKTANQSPVPAAHPILVAATCFKTGEQVSGMNKICYYNCLGSEAAITVGAASLCPLSINR